ncbi:MAG: glycoside hydrolase family 3 protein [Micrococcales bacterium]|nr:glycoside hydrolase family 3 protein [Micrococcales bacterium]
MRVRCVAVSVALVALTACNAGGGAPTMPTTVDPNRTTPPPTTSAPARDVALETWEQLTTEQRAGQLIMVAVHAGQAQDATRALVADRGVGSVILLGNTWGGATAVGKTSAALQALAGPVPLFVATDQEGGRVQHLTGPGFSTIPSALKQGAMTPQDLRTAAKGWGTELGGAGVNFDLAPVLDLVEPAARTTNDPVGVLERDFGHDGPGNAASARAFLAGMHDAGVATCVKHFPGLGMVTGNTDFTAKGIVDTRTTTTSASVLSFGAVLDNKPTAVMMSLATYEKIDPAGPAAFSSVVVTGLLRGELGWDGLVVSDSLDAVAVTSVPAKHRALRFVTAGGDLAIFASAQSASAALDGLLAAAAADPAVAEAIDRASLRVIRAKAATGLLG